MDKDSEIEKFAKSLGYGKLFFKESFNSLGLFEAKDYDTNRRLVEKGKIKVLVNPHLNDSKISFHHRSSGLDHIICNFANKNNVAIGFSFNSITDAKVLGKIKQNIMLCRKYKVKIVFFSFAESKYEMRSVQDFLSFLRTIGMTGKEAKDAMNYFS